MAVSSDSNAVPPVKNPEQLSICAELGLDPVSVRFPNGRAVNTFVEIAVGKGKCRYWIFRSAGKLKLDDARPSFSSGGQDGGYELSERHELSMHDHATPIPDVAAMIDSEDEELSDVLAQESASPAIVAKFFLWHRRKMAGHKRSLDSEAIRLVISFLMDTENRDIAVWALAIAAKMDCAEGKSLTYVGMKLGVTKEIVSRVANEITDKFDFPRSPSLKTHESRAKYSKAQHKNHFRLEMGDGWAERELRKLQAA